MTIYLFAEVEGWFSWATPEAVIPSAKFENKDVDPAVVVCWPGGKFTMGELKTSIWK